MYLTYAEYQNMGGTLEEATFNDLAYEAQTYIDWVTFRRLQEEGSDIPDAVKQCMYHIIRLIANKLAALQSNPNGLEAHNESGAGIQSQSNDGVSISYNTLSAKDLIATMNDEIDDTINRYLQGIRNNLGKRLLYRGLYPGE